MRLSKVIRETKIIMAKKKEKLIMQDETITSAQDETITPAQDETITPVQSVLGAGTVVVGTPELDPMITLIYTAENLQTAMDAEPDFSKKRRYQNLIDRLNDVAASYSYWIEEGSGY